MRQFDVCRTTTGTLVIVLQSDYWSGDPAVRIVAPIRHASEVKPIARVDIPVSIDGEPHVVRMSQLAAIQAKVLGSTPLANVADQRDAFIAAIDLIFLGF